MVAELPHDQGCKSSSTSTGKENQKTGQETLPDIRGSQCCQVDRGLLHHLEKPRGIYQGERGGDHSQKHAFPFSFQGFNPYPAFFCSELSDECGYLEAHRGG